MAGMTSGCPLHNLIPETNDLVWRGALPRAWQRLQSTNCLPEFTARVCPALCEAACTCAKDGDAVCTKENERAIVEYAFAHGLVGRRPAAGAHRQNGGGGGQRPAGLAAAWLLNRRGHRVTVWKDPTAPVGCCATASPT